MSKTTFLALPHLRGQGRRARSRGMGALTVIVILVLLGGVSAAMLRLSVSQSRAMADDLSMARALNAARSGIQIGSYNALKGVWIGCAPGTTQTVDSTADTGFLVTVSCSSTVYNNGETSVGVPAVQRIYVIDAVACNGTSGSCPDNAAAANLNYVERRLQATLTD